MSIIDEIAAERSRQRTKERYSLKHDDSHKGFELARAAAVYAAGPGLFRVALNAPTQIWPYQWEYKPKDKRTDLIRAAALIVAEIERMDRASPPTSPGAVK